MCPTADGSKHQFPDRIALNLTGVKVQSHKQEEEYLPAVGTLIIAPCTISTVPISTPLRRWEVPWGGGDDRRGDRSCRGQEAADSRGGRGHHSGHRVEEVGSHPSVGAVLYLVEEIGSLHDGHRSSRDVGYGRDMRHDMRHRGEGCSRGGWPRVVR